MSNSYMLRLGRSAVACILMSVSLLFSTRAMAQIYAPEGLNMVGEVETPNWVNPPNTNSPLGSEFQVTNGGMKLLTVGTRRWHATFTATATATQQFLFTTGPSGTPWNNKWANVTPVSLNTMQTYTYQGGTNNTINVTAGKRYTLNWKEQNPDNNVGTTDGYINTQAVFMETTNAPVTISSTSQSPLAASVHPTDPVDVTVNTSASLSPEEKVYIRYTTNSYASSTLLQVTMVGNSGTAQIPAQIDGTSVQYYAFTSTGTTGQIGTDYDMFTINSGGGDSYTSTALTPVNVTFQVDMANETVNGSGVHLAGSFNSFNTGNLPLTLVSGTIYAVTIPLAQNSTVQYKYLNGNTVGDYESVPGACANAGNREFTVGDHDVTIPLHCYGTCNACVPAVPVTFRVNMTGLTVSGNGVHIAGDFGSLNPVWNPGAIAMTSVGGGVYEATINIVPGRTVPYKFINGNAWGSEEGVPGACNVSGNRQIVVPNSAYTVPLNCFGTCSNCVSVTFNVDMNGLTISGNGVHVAGAFQSWNPGTTALTHIGGGIYSATVNMDVNTTSQYKFVNGNSWGTDESVPGICQSSGNRVFTVGTSNLNIPAVCFGRCISCSATSVWTGQNDSNFGNGNNWTAGVAPPASGGCSFNIQVNPANNQPTLSGTFSAGNVTVVSGATVTLNGGATLGICGSLNGGGSFTGAGNVELNGVPAQTLGGNNTFSNLTLNKPSTTTITGNSRVRGVLTLANSTSNLVVAGGGSLVLVSDNLGTGSIAAIPSGASVTGNVTQQRYLPGTGNGWFFLGTPITGGNFSQWTDDMYMAAGSNLGGNQGVVGIGNQHSTIFKYTESVASIYGDTVEKYGWRVPVLGDLLNPGQGFRVWLKGYNTPSRTIDNVGSVTQGTFTFPSLTRTEVSNCQPNGTASTIIPCTEAWRGWNLVANPFPSALDWNSAGWTKPSQMNNAFYIWNSAAGGYRAYNGTGATDLGVTSSTNTPANVIPSGQAFFVKLTTPGTYSVGTFAVQESAKTATNGQFVRTATTASNQIRIRLTKSDVSDYQFDGMLRFHETATNGYDQNLDMEAFPGSAFEFSLLGENGESLLLSAIPFSNQTRVIPMKMSYNGQVGTYTLSFLDVASLSEGSVYLKDNYLGTLTSTAGTGTYTFQVDSDESGNADRFELIVSPYTVTSVNKALAGMAVSFYPNPSHGSLSVDVKGVSESHGTLEIADVLGKVVYRSTNAVKDLNGKVFPLNLPAGVYSARMIFGSNTFTEKLIVQ